MEMSDKITKYVSELFARSDMSENEKMRIRNAMEAIDTTCDGPSFVDAAKAAMDVLSGYPELLAPSLSVMSEQAKYILE